VVVAQRLGDDGGWDLQDELAQRGDPAGQGGDAEITDELAEVAGVQRLAGPASGKQPAGTGVGGGLQVVALGGGLQQQGGERVGCVNAFMQLAGTRELDRRASPVDAVCLGDPCRPR
jgi:hypothetical protein